MARWQDVVDSEPEFANRVLERFTASKHAFLATIRADGSPRITGIETTFTAGEVWLGMMPGSRKAQDLQRDPRFALHSASDDAPSDDPSAWPGDAKLRGLAVAVTDPATRAVAMGAMPGGGHPPDDIPLFRLDLADVVVTRVGQPADHLVLELWRPGQPLRRIKRT